MDTTKTCGCDCWTQTLAVLKYLVPLALWIVFWLCAVNWKKTWTILAQGAWAPVVLLLLISAAVWSRLDPVPCTCLPFITIPSFWWHLSAVAGLAGLALFCGWLQSVINWTPPEYAVEPPAGDHGHGHDHGHH